MADQVAEAREPEDQVAMLDLAADVAVTGGPATTAEREAPTEGQVAARIGRLPTVAPIQVQTLGQAIRTTPWSRSSAARRSRWSRS